MNNSNIKLYLGISFALIVLFVLIIIIPFTKKPSTSLDSNSLTPSPILLPTNIETNTNIIGDSPTPIEIKATFTGALNEELPQPMINLSEQKKDLQSKVPLTLSGFTVDFDYSEDKFTILLAEPKDQSQKEFDNWRTVNYPSLETSQFIFK